MAGRDRIRSTSWSNRLWAPGVIAILALTISCGTSLEESGISRSTLIESEARKDLVAIYNAIHEYVDLHNDVPRDRLGHVSFEPLLGHQVSRYLPLEKDALTNRFWDSARHGMRADSVFCLNPKLTAQGLNTSKHEIILASRPGAFEGITEVEYGEGPGETVFVLFSHNSFCDSFTAHSERYEEWFRNFSSENQDRKGVLLDVEGDLRRFLLVTEEEWTVWRNRRP